MPHQRAKRKPTFHAQAILIVLPFLILVAVGVMVAAPGPIAGRTGGPRSRPATRRTPAARATDRSHRRPASVALASAHAQRQRPTPPPAPSGSKSRKVAGCSNPRRSPLHCPGRWTLPNSIPHWPKSGRPPVEPSFATRRRHRTDELPPLPRSVAPGRVCRRRQNERHPHRGATGPETRSPGATPDPAHRATR
jgi:hypothetical protein